MSSVISRISIAAVCLSTLLNASDKPLKVAAANLYANTRNHNVEHDQDGFSVNGQRVKQEDLSSDLQGKSRSAIASLLTKKRLEVTRTGADYRLNTRETLRGGGPIGAWLGGWVGYTTVMAGSKLLVAGIAYPIGLVCPPAGVAVAIVGDTIASVVVQPIAVAAAAGGSIAGAVLTGPA